MMSSRYDPEWTAFESSMDKQPPWPEDVNVRVQAFNAMLVHLQTLLSPTDPGVETRDERINSNVKVRIYTPPTTQREPAALPLLLFIHGGGYHAGNLDTEDHICRYVCSSTPAIVVSVDYRMVLMHKFPTPIDDCYDAFLWARKNAQGLGADPEKCLVWGGSAGGGLAIAVTYRLVQRGERVAGLVVMAPMSLHPEVCPKEYKDHHTAYVENGGEIPVVNASDAMAAFDMLGSKEDLPAWRKGEWFPQTAGAGAFKNFPPTWIINTDLECFRDDGRVLQLELSDAGAKVKREVMEGWPHYFWCFPVIQGGNEFRGRVVQGIKWILEESLN